MFARLHNQGASDLEFHGQRAARRPQNSGSGPELQVIPMIRIPYPESIDENRHNLQNKSELRVTSLESHRFLILFQCTTKMYYECCIWSSIINRKEK